MEVVEMDGGDRTMHLIMDSHCNNQHLMTKMPLLRDWLVEVAELAKMTVYGEPQIIDFPWPGSDFTALSGVCFLGESGIMVHTYPEKQAVFIDIFSCKDFDVNLLVGHTVRAFGMYRPRVLILDRGVDMKSGQIIPAHLVENYDAWEE